jgi:O-antigen ligase
VAVLALSVSRIGWLTFLAMVGLLMLLLNIRWARSLMKHLFRSADSAARKTRLLKIGFTILWVLVSVAVYASLIVAAGYVLSKVDTRMARLFDLSLIREQSFFHWANHLVFAERIVFWQAGWEIFNDFPLMGTGLGNSGYFFPQELSAFSWALTEIRILMYQWTALPNIKSLWVRLLAETGIVGFGLFISWLYVLWHSAVFLRAQNNRLQQMVGLAGSFMLVAFLLEGFSLDTFALPYYWITFGLVTAACGMAMSSRREPHSPDIDPAGN